MNPSRIATCNATAMKLDARGQRCHQYDPDAAIDAGQQGIQRHRDQHVDERRDQQVIQQDHPTGDETGENSQ
jgi:hypothetical protein